MHRPTRNNLFNFSVSYRDALNMNTKLNERDKIHYMSFNRHIRKQDSDNYQTNIIYILNK